MTWRSLPSDNGFVSTITPSATTHTATTTALVAYTHLAVTSSGVLYGSFSRSTVTSGGLSNPWSAGVSRWTGTAWQIVYERVASGSSTAWIGGPLAIDSMGNVWVALHESVTNVADHEAVRLWVVAITPAGALPILRRLSDEVPINSAYSATFANTLTVFSTGQVLVGGITNGLSSATRTFGVQRGFLITLHSDGTVLEQHELQGSSNYEQWIIDLIEAAGDAVVTGMQSVGSNGVGFIGHATVFKPVLPNIPDFTTSYYQGRIAPRYNRKQGCLARMRGEQGLVILTYGSPRGPENTIPPLDNQGNPTYGAGLLPPPLEDQPPPASIADIETSVQDYIDGYISYQLCNTEFAGEIQIPAEPNLPIPNAKLVIGVGSSNSPLGGVVPRLNPGMTTNHARAWAQMVNRLRDYIQSNSYAGVRVAGAFDAEPAWWNVDVDGQPPYQQEDSLTSRTPTYAWLDAFEDESDPDISLYMFSSLDGAPRTTTTWLGNDGSLIPNANLEQRYALLTSTTGKRKIIPQAYYLPYDKEWYQFRWFAKLNYAAVRFDGVMSQAQSSGITWVAIGQDRRFWPEYTVDYYAVDPTDPKSLMQNLPPDQAWLMFHDVLHRTLVSDYLVPANFTLPSDFVLAPLDAGLEVSIASTTACRPRVNPASDGLYAPPDSAENHFFRGACFPSGTVLPREMTIPSFIEGFPSGVQPRYNQITRGELPWLTDIDWGY
ncbi:hypothetical protein [Herpetosiphon gulosus]|uniref:Uncharacterized protein n=1 Tax=Herpetosiphon gulosus TaxID=1973496 RepID=A0ABP9X5U4_9CHLR